LAKNIPHAACQRGFIIYTSQFYKKYEWWNKLKINERYAGQLREKSNWHKNEIKSGVLVTQYITDFSKIIKITEINVTPTQFSFG